MHLSDCACLRRRRPRKPPSAPSRDATPVSRGPGHQPSVDPTQKLDTTQQGSTGHPSISRWQDEPTSAIPGRSSITPTPGPQDSIVQPTTHLCRQTSSDPPEQHNLLPSLQRSPVPMTAPQDPFSGQMTPSLSEQRWDRDQGMLVTQSIHDSRNVSVEGNMNTVTYTNVVIGGTNSFMEKLLEKTILGAAFDSSARNPPPRCHPGTRLAILARCVEFIVNSVGEKKIRWVVGAAGVGKSAIMQSVAESALPVVIWQASIFFSINGRSDGTKAVITLAYQLASKCEPYHQFIEREITRDPSLLQSSMSVQFNKFVIEPFIHHPLLNSAGRVLIIIDGLDECDYTHTQRELLELISDFCLTYTSSPIVWMIASRPEHHITSFFSQARIEATFEKEEILVDDDQAREDVERFLRVEMKKIQDEFSLNPRMLWPPEQAFWKLAIASGGLFVYANTVVRYIGDPDIGDPTLQLDDVLQVIDAHPLPTVPGQMHPMRSLDALYSQILSKVPTRIMANTRKLLLALVAGQELNFNLEGRNFIVLCNWLDMTCDEAYAAIRHLSSVLDIPNRDTAHMQDLRSFHKSFIDYLSDFTRSGFSHDIELEAHQLYVKCTFRILEQAPDGIDVGDLDYEVRGWVSLGTLARCYGTGSSISLTWSVDGGNDWDDNKTTLYLYKMAFASVVDGIERRDPAFYTVFCIRLLATRFRSLTIHGLRNLDEVVFDESRRHDLIEQGLLKHIPVKMLNAPDTVWETKLQFRRRFASPEQNLSEPWNLSCGHTREGDWGEGADQAWSTKLHMLIGAVFRGCKFCLRRLEQQLVRCRTQFPDHPALVLFTSAGVGLVEFQFVDVEDGMSEWTYWFVCEFSEEERKKLGSIV